jgi:hypothetical protein
VGARECVGGGSISSGTPIPGLTPALDTPGELATAIQTLQTQSTTITAQNTALTAQVAALAAQVAAQPLPAQIMLEPEWDTDDDGRIDPNKQQSREFVFLTPQLVWNCPHSFGRIPEMTCYDLLGNTLSDPPTQNPTLNTSIINWLMPQAGKAVFT